jgi:hypothetical protein
LDGAFEPIYDKEGLREMANPDTEVRRIESKRIQFEFPADAVERLDRLKLETTAGTYAELVRNALRVYEWVVDIEKKGFEVGVVKDNNLIKVVKFMY